ncbi:MAG: hypothetical protein HC849_02445 [Oscillatoriales cyanobacterium RU_3_3]|nr:hypothetical protein [Oscillatoriales cyanobacterium RU_3_3]
MTETRFLILMQDLRFLDLWCHQFSPPALKPFAKPSGRLGNPVREQFVIKS